MKLSDARENYYVLSGAASAAARQVAFAGIAVVWVFNRPAEADPINLPESLLWALLLCALALLLDVSQYALGALIWGYYSRHIEKRHAVQADPAYPAPDDPEFSAPPWFNWPSLACFWGKLLVLALGYGVLLDFLRQFL